MPEKQKNWIERIKAWEKSGISQREYCREKNISFSAFQYWRKRLKKKPEQFVEIRVKPVEQSDYSTTIIELPNGIILEIEKTDFEAVKRLLLLLKDLV